jgi:hypothetical protein
MQEGCKVNQSGLPNAATPWQLAPQRTLLERKQFDADLALLLGQDEHTHQISSKISLA